MAEEPKLLVLDEPFGGLDAGERALLAQQIRRLHAQGTAVLVIDHVLDDLFSVAHRVLAFDFGRTIGEGTPDTVLDNPRCGRRTWVRSAAGPSCPSAVGERSVLRLSGVGHTYGGVVALRDVDLDVREGVVLGIAGANGAGKSTLAGILHGSLKPARGSRETGGTVRTSLAPEGRALFKTLSLRENLEVAAYAAGITGAPLRERLAETTEWLPPRLRERMSVSAAGLSGGEQQMLAIARALIVEPGRPDRRRAGARARARAGRRGVRPAGAAGPRRPDGRSAGAAAQPCHVRLPRGGRAARGVGRRSGAARGPVVRRPRRSGVLQRRPGDRRDHRSTVQTKH